MPPCGDIFACTFNYFYCLLLIFNCSNNLPDKTHLCQEYLYSNYCGVVGICTPLIHSGGRAYLAGFFSCIKSQILRMIFLE